MFPRIIDSINANYYGKRRLKWTDIVDTFRLKYPKIHVRPPDSDSTIPDAFLVFRSLPNTFYIQDLYQYEVDLFSAKEKIFEEIENFGRSRFNYLAAEPWRKRCSKSISELTEKHVFDARGHVLNWGLFDYKCKFGVGEFAADGYGFGVNFLDTFVLEEDRHIFEKNSVSLIRNQ